MLLLLQQLAGDTASAPSRGASNQSLESPDTGKKRIDVISVRNNQTRSWMKELDTMNKRVSEAIVDEQKLRDSADNELDSDFLAESRRRSAVACAWAGKAPDFSSDLSKDRKDERRAEIIASKQQLSEVNLTKNLRFGSSKTPCCLSQIK